MKQVNTLQVRGASIRTSVVLDHQKILLALVAVTGEGHVDRDDIVVQIMEITVDMDTIDNTIGQVEKSRLDVGRHGGGAGRVDLNGGGGEGLVETRLESQGESSASLSSGTVSNGEGDSLGLVLGLVQLVLAAVHHVITERAHALGAVHISVLRVADAAAGLGVVELVVAEGLLELGELEVLVGELSSAEGKLIDVFAGTVSRAVIGARRALAALAFVALEALTLARFTVAKTLASTLGVSVTSVVSNCGVHNLLRVVHPRELEGADSVRAITGVMGHTETPVVITDTEPTVAFTMTTARVVTS